MEKLKSKIRIRKGNFDPDDFQKSDASWLQWLPSLLTGLVFSVFLFPNFILMTIIFVSGFFMMFHAGLAEKHRIDYLRRTGDLLHVSYYHTGTIFYPLNQGNQLTSQLPTEQLAILQRLGGLAGLSLLSFLFCIFARLW